MWCSQSGSLVCGHFWKAICKRVLLSWCSATVSSEAFGCGQKSCLCHFRSSILITLSSAYWAPGGLEKRQKSGEKKSLIYLGMWSVRWGRCLSRPPPLRLHTSPSNHTRIHRKRTFSVAHTCTVKWIRSTSETHKLTPQLYLWLLINY